MGDKKSSLKYSIRDSPPIHLAIVLGFQQFLTLIGGSIAFPLMVAEAACVGPDLVGRAQILGTIMFVNGICTFLQIFVGVRLPIVQGPSFVFLAPMLAMQHVPDHKCPTPEDYATWRIFPGSSQHRALWMGRMAEIQLAILIAGLLELLIGCLGLVSFLFRFIGPLTVAPTMSLIALSLIFPNDPSATNFGAEHFDMSVFNHGSNVLMTDVISKYAGNQYWPITLLSLGLVLLFTLYLAKVGIPLPFPELVAGKWKCVVNKHQIFSLFPIVLSIGISWIVYLIVDACNAWPKPIIENANETLIVPDVYISEISAAPWFRIPYPGQWGAPRFNLALTIGMFAAILASIVESVGDYCACARICGIRLPPSHALNRGIAVEGFGSVLAGAFGSGPGMTSYSENIGAIGITKVGSRFVIFITACILVVFGCFTKIAAFFAMIPDPITGGILIAMLSMIGGVGFSNLQFIDMNSMRNLLIFGLSIFLGLAIPTWVKSHSELIDSGSQTFDQVLIVLLSNGMFVGGFIGFVLDNTAPKDGDNGSEYGSEVFDPVTGESVYDLPLITNWIRNIDCLRYCPLSPSFKLRNIFCSECCRKNKEQPPEEPPNPSVLHQVKRPATADPRAPPTFGPSLNAAFSPTLSRTVSQNSLTLSFSNASGVINPSVKSAPMVSKDDEKWTDL